MCGEEKNIEIDIKISNKNTIQTGLGSKVWERIYAFWTSHFGKTQPSHQSKEMLFSVGYQILQNIWKQF